MSKIAHFSTVALRTTTYPYQTILNLLNNNSSNWLDDLLGDEYFLTAMQLASPDLLSEAIRMNKEDNDNPELDRIKQSILKYASRMSTRCTPFGLFSGVGTVGIEINADSKIEIAPKEKHGKHCRLDMNFSVQLVNEINRLDTVKNTVSYFTNTTLYPIGDNYRLVSYTIKNKSRQYDLISVERNEYLDQILEKANSGAKREELIHMLVDLDIDFDEAFDYINDLIDSQLIISELEPSTLGTEVEFELLNKLEKIYPQLSNEKSKEDLKRIINYLQEVTKRLDAINQLPATKERYDELIDLIMDKMPLKIEGIDRKYLIQCNVALETSKDSRISETDLNLVKKAIRITNRFLPDEREKSKTDLAKFKKAFQERYDDKFVPLVEALDVETGIGYASRLESEGIDHTPFINSIPLDYKPSNLEQFKWNKKVNTFWFTKILEAKENNSHIELTNDDLKPFPEKDLNYSASFIAKTALFHKEDKSHLHFEFYGGSTASLWYGRFCNSNPSLAEFNQEIIDFENAQNDDYIIAEVNHLPESRLGNVIHRKTKRNWQINYLSGINQSENDININDLYIGIKQERVVLLSKKHNKVIRTYHSNAFNSKIESNLPIFQFLADLETEYYKAMGNLNIESFHRFFKFIPRVTHENIIFQRASWSFGKDEFKDLQNCDDQNLVTAFKEFRTTWKLPEQFVIKVSDNELLIHSGAVQSLKILLAEVKKNRVVQLVEFLPAQFDSIIKDKKGNTYNNELLFNFKMKAPQKVSPINISQTLRNDIPAIFPPGSEWVYFKIYLGIKTSNKLLTYLKPHLELLKANGVIDKWFFIRYLDPKVHIRLRLKLSDLDNLGMVMTQLYQLFEHFKINHPIDKVVMDTYQRELDRYGYDLIPEFEHIFGFDSRMSIELIEHCTAHEKMDLLWVPTLYAMHTFLELFDFSEQERETYIDWHAAMYRKEFNAYSETTKVLNKRYKDNKGILFPLFIDSDYSEFNSFVAIIEKRNTAIRPYVNKIKTKYPNFNDRMNYLSSLLHMSVNRQFRSSQRMYEFVLYDFLQKMNKTMQYCKPQKVKS